MRNPKIATGTVSYAPTSSTASAWSFKQLLAESARDWKLSQGMIFFIVLLPFIIALVGASTALMGKEIFKWFTDEDRFAENLQVVIWALTFLLGFIVMRRIWNAGYKSVALLYLLLNIGIFFLIGEEVSWGQRIFGWETPESMMAMNKQKETNLHNIHGVGDTFKWIHVIIGFYGTFLPLIARQTQALARHRKVLSMLVPHYVLLPYFAAALLWRLQANLWNPPKRLYFVIISYSEVIELILCTAFLLFMVFQLRSIKSASDAKPAR
jgi:hypothetical protein